jgi:ribose transport system ATP-binding protein
MAPILKLSGVSKTYGGVHALRETDFECEARKIHAVLGENGAGKSTLMKILTGVIQPNAGQMWLDGREVAFAKPIDALRAEIVCIFQELSLIPDLTVADNICLFDPPKTGFMVNKAAQDRIAREYLARFQIDDIHPRERVSDLPLSRRQIVEIAKALRLKPKILILDEATSALTAGDVERVFTLLKTLRQEGMTILYISHRMNEIAELADDCSVFRNGTRVAQFKNGDRSHDEIVEMMIGREYVHSYPAKPKRHERPEPILEVEYLSWTRTLKGISLTAGPGEIIGLGGLDGQGQREFLLALFGVLKGVRGSIRIAGESAMFDGPGHAKRISTGVALIPEDRKTEGLMMRMSIRDNLSMAVLDQLSSGLTIDRAAERSKIAEVVDLLKIKFDKLGDGVGFLSGGNQQKVVMGKWLMTSAKIILLNDPTRGIDVGTKHEVYTLLRKLADEGACILFYSTDYDELIGCCDQVAVFYEGRIVQTLEGDEITEEALVASALNIHGSAAVMGTA